MNLDYSGFSPRHYGFVLYKPHKKVFLLAVAAFIGRAMVESPKVLEELVGEWIQHKKKNPVSGVFRFKDRYLLPNSDDKKKKTDILSLSKKQLFNELVRKISLSSNEGTSKLVTVSGRDVFNHPMDNKKYSAHVSRSELTGDVIAKSDARRHDVYGRKRVTLKGVFRNLDVLVDGDFLPLLDTVDCTCKSSVVNQWRQVRVDENDDFLSSIDVLCPHSFALLYYSSINPRDIDGFRQVRKKNSGAEFFVPFNVGSTPSSVFKFRDHDQDMLLVDVLMEKYLNGSKGCVISQRLFDNPSFYDSFLFDWLDQGKAGFEVVPSVQGPGMNAIVSSVYRQLFKQLRSDGFVPQGFVFEHKGSDYQVVCPNFEKGDELVRILFNNGFPPIVAERYFVNNPRPDLLSSDLTNLHPYHLLVSPNNRFTDDRSRRVSFVDYSLPDVNMPDSMINDYKEALNSVDPSLLGELKKKMPKHHKLYSQLFV